MGYWARKRLVVSRRPGFLYWKGLGLDSSLSCLDRFWDWQSPYWIRNTWSPGSWSWAFPSIAGGNKVWNIFSSPTVLRSLSLYHQKLLYHQRLDSATALIIIKLDGARGSVVIKALCYKPEGRGFENRWGDCISSVYLIIPAALGPGFHSTSNRNEYRKQKNNASGEWSVTVRKADYLTALPSLLTAL
jgi:hypothetical protein